MKRYIYGFSALQGLQERKWAETLSILKFLMKFPFTQRETRLQNKADRDSLNKANMDINLLVLIILKSSNEKLSQNMPSK